MKRYVVMIKKYGIRKSLVRVVGKILLPKSEVFICDNGKIDEDKSKKIMMYADPYYYNCLSKNLSDFKELLMANYETLSNYYLQFLDEYTDMTITEIKSSYESLINSPLNKTHTILDYSFYKYAWQLFALPDNVINNSEQIQNTPELQLMVICELLQKNNIDEAKRRLLEYHKKYKMNYISNYLPVSYLADQLGIINEDIHKSKVVFENFMKNINYFKKYKKILIIGNGTINQKITIDGFDGIIRFNQYDESIDVNHNIWLRNNDPSYFGIYHTASVESIDCIMTDKDIWRWKFDNIVINDFYNYVGKGKAICYLSNITEIHELYGIHPSSGFATVYYLLESYNELRIILYGFLDDQVSTYYHDYRQEEKIQQFVQPMRHNKTIEVSYLKSKGLI